MSEIKKANIIVKRLANTSEVVPCHRSNCQCAHTSCNAGWVSESFIIQEEKRFKGVTNTVTKEYDGVRPCPICDPERAQIFATSKTPEELALKLRQRSQFKIIENYDNQDASKTRTL